MERTIDPDIDMQRRMENRYHARATSFCMNMNGDHIIHDEVDCVHCRPNTDFKGGYMDINGTLDEDCVG